MSKSFFLLVMSSTTTQQNDSKTASTDPFSAITQTEQEQAARKEKELSGLQKEKEEVVSSLEKKREDSTNDLKAKAKEELQEYIKTEGDRIFKESTEAKEAELNNLESNYKNREDETAKNLVSSVLAA